MNLSATMLIWCLLMIGGEILLCKAQPHLGFFCELPSANISTYITVENLKVLKQLNASLIMGTVDLSAQRAAAVKVSYDFYASFTLR